jgi:short-chain fatty acids transporter
VQEEKQRNDNSAGPLSLLAIRLADWLERWFPDALVFALAAVIIVFLGGIAAGESAGGLTKNFGDGFWELIPFTLQMVMIVVGGYVVATAAPIARVIRWLAHVPHTPRAAIAFIALVAMTTALVSWGFSLIFTALLVRHIVQNIRGVDYRAAGAAAYLGVGTVWALGLSSSAALMMATETAIPPAILKISGRIPLSHTIFAWQSMVMAALLILSSVLVAYLTSPSAENAKTAEALNVKFDLDIPVIEGARKPGEWLEYSGLLTVLVCGIGFSYLLRIFWVKGPLAALDLNTYNFLFIMLGMFLHWRPRAFAASVASSVPATAGILIQFPFYAGIFGMLTKSGLSGRMADFFVRVSTRETYPLLVAAYSAILGLFVPSGGSKWVIEAPYVLTAAKQLHVNLGWVVQIYNTAEALPNLINPFWMLPLIGLLNIRAREVVGYSCLYLIVNLPLVLFGMWYFARTMPYVAPGAY